jgi:hypothetical protein
MRGETSRARWSGSSRDDLEARRVLDDVDEELVSDVFLEGRF